MIKDLFGTELKIGDYISYPVMSVLKYSKVLKITNRKYGGISLKLSCELTASAYFKGFYKKACSLRNLYDHNSFFYKHIRDTNFIIINDFVGDPIDSSQLYTRNKLKKQKDEKVI